MANSRWEHGAYASNEDSAVWHGREHTPYDRPGVLCFAGHGSNTEVYVAGYRDLLCPLADAGFPVLTADWSGPEHWGGDTGRSHAADGETFVQGAKGQATSGKVALVGISMGGILAMRYAMQQGSAGIACLILIATVPELVRFYNESPSSRQAEIEDAYDGAAPTAAHDPSQNTAAFGGIPVLAYRSSADDVAPADAVDTFCAAVGGTVIDLGAITHSEAIVAVDGDDVLPFVEEHA